MKRGETVVVLGLGVSGLSCAARLAEAGFRVRAIGAAPPLSTTSAVAAAVWYPYRVGPADRVQRWAATSLREFGRLAELPGSGVAWVEGIEVLEEPAPLPAWLAGVPGARRARRDELPPHRADGYAFRVPRIEMERYLPWLAERLRHLRVDVAIERVESLAELCAEEAIVVNCTGLASRELAGDRALYPIRGQLVRIAPGSVDRFVVDETGGAEFAFLVPRSSDAILGGTAHEGREDLAPVAAESDAIVARCAKLEPRVASARRLDERVGLRPGRESVRLETERLGRALLVHDYGHGGAGVTLSWGCADEVCQLVRSAVSSVGGRR